ncbi:MAG: NUDIX domain-containing protein [Tissierellia bacterium]|nr:NUDIX domain-containing protein [Tissierellia bacterium]
MKTIMMNMIRILNKDKVVVLDKVKKYGWEGLTFPGGKVEDFETLEQAAIREAKEETNLDILDLSQDGIIIWYDYDRDERLVGILYTAKSFKGDLNPINREGRLYFQNYEEFKKEEKKSASMDDILSIYDGKYKEVCLYYKNDKLIESRRN